MNIKSYVKQAAITAELLWINYINDPLESLGVAP